ncbi:hypothetical protein [Methylobacterium sp. J-090]|uniref:hypothetical protein n=1 Tax=Methylobacterium sp. J-090 TaxID=2836666 RepID=UPI001FB8A066|nr:hypothetical protein [Methylobacterium sp. J-090]MCJ2084259.1 hypothetical protein [Methylobacterium sp. J-090]
MAFLSDSVLPAATALGIPLLLLGTPETGRPVLVIAPPGSGAARIFDLVGRADGRVLRGAGLAWMAVAVSERPDFPRRLRDAGAWAVVSASSVAGCPTTREP